MGHYLSAYRKRIEEDGKPSLSRAIQKTVDEIIPTYIADFSFREHIVGLLVGDVQSGKTSHIFGLMTASADEGFGIFLLLTTDSVVLQQQTLKRAQRDLTDFCVCDESDYIKFLNNGMRKPVVVVLKKNGSVLREWKNNFTSTHFVAGNPLFIVDDEADAASLNTLVNRNRQSTINKCLDEIKRTTSSSVYLQVTGTPQSILLQSIRSGWRPSFIYYFRPGVGYLGGDFFFGDPNNAHIVLTDNDEANDLLDDEEFPENGLKTALIMHLFSAAHLMARGDDVCNFLIHPSVKISDHVLFAEKIGNYLNELLTFFDEPSTKSVMSDVYNSLKETKQDLIPFADARKMIRKQMQDDLINILVFNSLSPYEDEEKYKHGNNIIVGGNSLGRGVTFPRLQTVYYCRVAKNPQADTMWQHARMFGYDRDPDLMRVFMPPRLYKLFSDINTTNKNIIAQIENARNGVDIRIRYPSGLRPTRKNVLDKRTVSVYSGGVNYFPFEPTNSDISDVDALLSGFEDGDYSVSLRLMVNVLKHIGSEGDDWDPQAFIGFLNSLISDNSLAQGRLIVRRERDVAKGTGTLLSPNDRALGDSFAEVTVLTLYKVTGNKGWDSRKLWVPNIKLPGNDIYYAGEATNIRN